MSISHALEIDHRFSGFLACSIGTGFSFQALVGNVGAAAGCYRQGLTLPLISYRWFELTDYVDSHLDALRIDWRNASGKRRRLQRGSR